MNPFPCQRKSASAFTLVELLIVIAIIALLAAILFPVFARARENARRSSCQSNLKQLSLGLQQYTSDYDERFAIDTVVSPASADGSYGWAESLQTYIKNEQILQCPSDIIAAPTTTPLANQQQYTDYFYNMGLARSNGNNIRSGVLESQLDFPTYTIAFGDFSNSRTSTGEAWSTDRGGPGQGLASSTNPGWTKHLEGINLAFADGHVKWYKAGNVGSNDSTKIYKVQHPFQSGLSDFGNVTGSGDSPTFHVSDSITTQVSF